MSLRNAFANLLTESVTGAVEAVLVKMDTRQSRQALVEPPRSLQYARDSGDRMRVIVENAQQVYTYAGNSGSSLNGAGLVVLYGAAQAVFMVDERWQQAEQTLQSFNSVRAHRWEFS